MVRKIIRLVILAAAVAVLVHIVIDDARNNWLALIPGVILASAVYHFGGLALSKRSA